MLCEYGCGQEGKYQFKNDKWRCSKNVTCCEEIRRKNSNSSKNKFHSEETKQKMSFQRKGESHPLFGKKHSKETIKKMSKMKKGKIPWNKGKTGIYSNATLLKMSQNSKKSVHTTESKKKLSIAAKLTISKIKKKYPLFSKIEEMRYNPEKSGEKEIQVHCKNHKCQNSKEQGGWFTPDRESFFSRIYSIEGPYGKDGLYLYCCNECKKQCPLYGKTAEQLIKEDQIKVGIIKEKYYTTEEYNICKKEVFKRSNELCEYCGDRAEHIHHTRPQKLEPFFSLDPDYCISVCSNCHYKYGHKDECSTGNLANKICI